MKLTNKQAMMLFDIAKGSLAISGGCFSYNKEVRHQLVNTILNQQSDELIDLEER